uniref:Predicted protein n=1 Tax=Hordeum vulgare subsp. vulgare TaxID=112509 RepID=F2E286_HORVV|nr:predicted protein [Hordeum vulgare subsp. vulgare]
MDFGLPPIVVGPISFCLLVFASWCVGEGGEILGTHYDASVLGGIVIAWLNTAPEAIFFITALQSNNPRFAVGAVSGSTIVVCTVALGVCLWIGGSSVKRGRITLQPAVKTQCYILLCSVIVTTAIAAVGFNIILGGIGISFYCMFLFYSLRHKEADAKEDEETGHLEAEEEEEEVVPVQKGIVYLVVGAVLIFGFSSPFINCVVQFATYLEVNPILLAFFLAPIASEAPEILESISLSRKGNIQSINVAFSNLIGGTITKTTILCGLFSLIGYTKGFAWESPSYSLCLMLLGISAAIAAAIGAFSSSLSKYHGLLLLSVFVIIAIIQYATNSRLDSEVFADESFGHDDAHHIKT